MPVDVHSGCCIDLGICLFSESGYTGRNAPVKGYVGKGLKLPVSGSTLDTMLGGRRLRKGFVLLWRVLCSAWEYRQYATLV